jgi:hypothetical protein
VTDRITLPGLPDDDNATLARLVADLEAREPRNFLRASYYDGHRAIRQVGTIIPPMYYRLGIVLGWSGKAVDVLARRCNLERFFWPDGDLESLGYDEVWDRNSLGSELGQAMLSSLIHGPAFLVNTKGDTSAGEPPALIHVKDARQATGEWNPRKRRLDNLLSVTGVDKDSNITSLALYLDGRTVVASKQDGKWAVEDISEHAWGVPAEMLVYKPRVGRPYGQSRISRPIMSLHDAALRTVIRSEGHADVYSFPEMWLLGADSSIFKNEDGTPKAAWQVMLGRIKAIPDDEEASNPRADVKQFSASSPQPHIDQLKFLAQMFAGEASIPVTSLGVADSANPSSADAIVEAREDLISEAEGATEDWSTPMRRALARSLAMANGLDAVPAEWASIGAQFRSPMHLSRSAAADAGQKQLAAAPWLAETEVGLELLGLSDQQIRRAMADKRRATGSAALQAIQAAVAARPAAATAPPAA